METETVGKKKEGGEEEDEEIEMEGDSVSFTIAGADMKAIEDHAKKEGKNSHKVGHCYEMLANLLKQGTRPKE